MINFDWYSRFGYYITYFGEVYHGIAIYPDVNKEDFYIVPKQTHYQRMQQGKSNYPLDELPNLGVYIKTKSVIQNWMDENQFQRDSVTTPTYRWPEVPSKYKTMFVFGAGASANCVFGKGRDAWKDSALRPPLGPELFEERFDNIINAYAGLKLSLPKFEARNNEIELILEDDWNELISEYNPRLASQHIQIQFYLRHIFEGISLYVSNNHYRHNLYTLFLQKLFRSQNSDKRYLFVSFNYDSVFDQEIEKHFGLSFSSIEQYLSLSNQFGFQLFKPHGSWNWGWQFNQEKLKQAGGNIADWLYQTKVTPATLYYDLLGGAEMLNGWGHEIFNHPNGIGKLTVNRDKIVVTQPNKSYYPALLLPYRDKDDFVMPYTHQMMMSDMMQHVEELVLIGWKGSEKLFNKKLKEKTRQLNKITIVNPDFEGVKKALGESLDLRKYAFDHVKDFEDYVLNKLA